MNKTISKKRKSKTLIRKKVFIFLALLIFLVGMSILFVYVKPQEIIEIIGVKNGYLIIAIFALFGGISAFTSVSFYATLITFTIGGLNPFILALVTAPSLFIGDSVYYYFGHVLNDLLSERMIKFIERIKSFILRPKIYKISPIFIYLYVGVSPLPPDILIIALSISKYPYKRMIVPLLLGEITFVLLVSLFAQQGIRIFGL